MGNLKSVVDLEGSTAVSKVILDLLNEFPGLGPTDHISFSMLSEKSGIAFYPTSGSVFLENREWINGHVKQRCLYPFTVTYRAAPNTDEQRMRIKEFLDLMGQWLEGQPIVISGQTYQLTEYPNLNSGNRTIKTVRATNASHLQSAYQDGIEDWVMAFQLHYTNEYDK